MPPPVTSADVEIGGPQRDPRELHVSGIELADLCPDPVSHWVLGENAWPTAGGAGTNGNDGGPCPQQNPLLIVKMTLPKPKPNPTAEPRSRHMLISDNLTTAI